MALKIVILEDNPDRAETMKGCVKDRLRHYEVVLCQSPREALDYLAQHLNDVLLLSLDHDMELQAGTNGQWIDIGSGREVADYLAGLAPQFPVVLHSSNSAAADGMERVLKESGWHIFRVTPFEDLSWIPTIWWRTIRQAILDTATPAVGNCSSGEARIVQLL